MALHPYFLLSPTTIVSLLGLMHGPDKTKPTPSDDWHKAVVDVIIPAYNEQEHVILCLDSIARQTFKPRKVILIDDGSKDLTSEYAIEFAKSIGLELDVIRHDQSVGKTPGLKQEARELDSDVEFIVDADTILESVNYIERVVQELYQGVGIASACGLVMPMNSRDRRKVINDKPISSFLEKNPGFKLKSRPGFFHWLVNAITNLYRSVLYTFLQKYLYHGQMVFFGTIVNPVGCAVAYRRKYIKDLFDKYESILGDNLTNSEDIFMGFALLDQGFRNIQVADVNARTVEPEVQYLPKQIYYWSSSFLQSCYYFNELVRSPLIAFKRWRHRHKEKHDVELQEIIEKRKVHEQYRQPFGIEHSRKYGRPMGWMIFTAAAEKVFFPTTLLIMAILQMWWALLYTFIAETLLTSTILAIAEKKNRLGMFFKSILISPIRYASILTDLVTVGIFTVQLWITKNKAWRK